VRAGDLFAALPGEKADGAAFVADAAARGAVAVLTPHELDLRTVNLDMPGLFVAQWTHADARRVVGRAAALVHGEPAAGMRVAGITGTNGKTTTAHVLGWLLEKAGRRPAVLGTAGHRLAGGRRVDAQHTTPDAPELWRLLREHRERGGDSLVLEVSSHALAQERTAGLAYDVAVFTNLTREHLDYHRGMEEYARAKARLFAGLSPGATAVLNLDDPYWVHMNEVARTSGARVVRYSTRSSAELTALRLSTGPQGTRFELDGMGIQSCGLLLPLRGRYNVENALAAAASALALGVEPADVIEGLSTTRGAPGRLEAATEATHPFQVYVDYAHSPDALERVLRTLRAELVDRGRLIVVFGCGGDRDRGKRPQMGSIASRLADVVWLTTDNARSEDPAAILAEIEAGMSGVVARRREPDRREAIHGALFEAEPGDIVLVAGKGHETRQWIGDQVLAFDDREVVREALG
jgi:UDP-N-acetylmuramoyl-L-alanyl-D-glutamate--2,6-diaminopimelate ligase